MLKKVLISGLCVISSVVIAQESDVTGLVNKLAPSINIKISPSVFGDNNQNQNQNVKSEVIKPAEMPKMEVENKSLLKSKDSVSSVQDVGYLKSLEENKEVKNSTGLESFNKDTVIYYNDWGWKNDQEKLKKAMKN